jgi:hypothetical protein
MFVLILVCGVSLSSSNGFTPYYLASLFRQNLLYSNLRFVGLSDQKVLTPRPEEQGITETQYADSASMRLTQVHIRHFCIAEWRYTCYTDVHTSSLHT